MKILKIHKDNPDWDILSLAVSVLTYGGVVIHPTDTCYGIAVDIHDEKAVEKLYAIKRMDLSKPTSIIVADDKMFANYGRKNKKAAELVDKFWPGALTIVSLKGEKVPDFYNKKQLTIGLRQPDCAISLELVRKLGRPVTTTSANITTNPSTYSIAEILEQFEDSRLKPDLILDAGELDRNRKPSTVVEISDQRVKVIRQGEVKV